MTQKTTGSVVDGLNASSTDTAEQLPTPASSSNTTNAVVPFIRTESGDMSTASEPTKTSKRKRASTPDNDTSEPVTPARSTKKSKPAGTPAKTPARLEEAAAKKAASVKKKADEAATKAAKAAKKKEAADTKKAEAQRKKQVAQWKLDWKDWIDKHKIKNPDDAELCSIEKECLTTTECKKYFRLQDRELECLRCDKQPNPYGRFPIKLYLYDEVVELAYKKEAIQAGVSQDHDEALIARGKELWEVKKG